MRKSDFDDLPFLADPEQWLGYIEGEPGSVAVHGDSVVVQRIGFLTPGQSRVYVEKSLLERVRVAIDEDEMTSLDALASAVCRWMSRTPELHGKAALYHVEMDGQLSRVGKVYLSRFGRLAFAHDDNPIQPSN